MNPDEPSGRAAAPVPTSIEAGAARAPGATADRLPFAAVAAPDTAARRGRLRTPHGAIETPQFMPVATAGSVRAQRIEDLRPAGATMLLANTWHLAHSPGAETVRRLGGLHRLMGWDGGLLTDSGGFQAWSLGALAQVDEGGVRLTHPASGQREVLTPESSVAAQVALGSDIAMVLDHLVPADASHPVAADAMERTHRWALRCLAARGDAPTGLFAIVQGAAHADLRRESAAVLSASPFDGFAIGGLAVGEPAAVREAVTAQVAAGLPLDRPRYLMGVGTPLDVLEAVHRGVDLFDCILPTAMAQRGRAYTSTGKVELRRTVYRDQDRPLDDRCSCHTCRTVSRAWLHHLFRAREPTAWTLLGLHNLHFWLGLMADVRAALEAGGFARFHADTRQWIDGVDLEFPSVPPRAKRRGVAPSRLGRFEVHHQPRFGGGPPFASVRHIDSGEVMHAVSPPDEEARRLYVEPSRLAARALVDGAPLILWDVGLGAAANAMEAIHAWEAAGGIRALEVHSFEHDLDALRLALANHDHFPRLRHGGPVALLRDGEWRGRGASVRWVVHLGELPGTLAAAPEPDLVWWDPFSFQANPALWSLGAFRVLADRCRTRPAEVRTYSNSTAVRVALLLAGFWVGPGPGSGPKSQTTIAWSGSPAGPVFDSQFLVKWSVSSRRWPADVEPAEEEGMERVLRSHAQWRAGV